MSRSDLISSSRTSAGNVRDLNEDAFIDSPTQGVFAVADGMGGHSAGDVASNKLVEALGKIKCPSRLSELVEFAEYHILRINKELFEFGQANKQITGTTVVALLIVEDFCAYLWAGDSRLYRSRGGQLEQLTTDHTQTELYIEMGLIDKNDADKFSSRNRITRAVGAAADLVLDVEVEELKSGDRFLLCSDGLDKHLNHDEIAEIIVDGSPENASQALINATLERGANDNVTVCIVDI
ncbi:MAG: PP2C family protein-serine/threonine phosphatase [Gammaproteobacteria bacterium]